MTKNWKITKKTIGAIQLAWGGFFLIFIILSVFDSIESTIAQSHLNEADISTLKVVNLFHHSIIVSIITLIAGILLLLNKRIGWLMSIVACASNFISIILSPILIVNNSQDLDLADIDLNTYVSFGLVALIPLVVLMLLLSKPILNNYNPTKKTWLIALITFTMILADQLIL